MANPAGRPIASSSKRATLQTAPEASASAPISGSTFAPMTNHTVVETQREEPVQAGVSLALPDTPERRSLAPPPDVRTAAERSSFFAPVSEDTQRISAATIEQFARISAPSVAPFPHAVTAQPPEPEQRVPARFVAPGFDDRYGGDTIPARAEASVAAVSTMTPPGKRTNTTIPVIQTLSEPSAPLLRESAPVEIRIGTIEVRASAPAPTPAAHVQVPQPMPPLRPAAMFPRSYSWRYGIAQS
jgi:hypothetical protein